MPSKFFFILLPFFFYILFVSCLKTMMPTEKKNILSMELNFSFLIFKKLEFLEHNKSTKSNWIIYVLYFYFFYMFIVNPQMIFYK